MLTETIPQPVVVALQRAIAWFGFDAAQIARSLGVPRSSVKIAFTSDLDDDEIGLVPVRTYQTFTKGIRRPFKVEIGDTGITVWDDDDCEFWPYARGGTI